MAIRRGELRESRWRWAFWPVPLIFLAVGLILPGFTHALDELVGMAPADSVLEFVPGSLAASQAVASTVATAMLSFIGVVFSISVVALQMTANQLSPRILRIFIRQRLTKWTLGVFIGTFAFALSVLGFLDEGGADDLHQFLPVFSILTVWLGVGASLVCFIAYVSRLIHLMQPVTLVDLTAAEAWAALAWTERGDASIDPEGIETGGLRFAVHSRATGVVTDIDVARLVRIATSGDWVLRVQPRIGDHLTTGSTLVEAYARDGGADGGEHDGRAKDGERGGNDGQGGVSIGWMTRIRIRRAFRFGAQRSVARDPAYGMRLLVDIAVRALSTSVGDPTTAVQVLDRVVELLRVAGTALDPTGVHTDGAGVSRVVRPVSSWPRLVELACTEIRRYGAGSAQVTRRMLACLNDLAEVLPAERHPPLEEQRRLLVAATLAQITSRDERRISLRPDRKGLG